MQIKVGYGLQLEGWLALFHRKQVEQASFPWEVNHFSRVKSNVFLEENDLILIQFYIGTTSKKLLRFTYVLYI